MFFKMLRSDLKRKKGLNVILFIFITIASILVFAGSVQIFSNITSERTAKRLCKSSDTIFWRNEGDNNSEETQNKISEILTAEDNVVDWSSSPITRISVSNLDFPDYEEKNSYIFVSKPQCLITLPKEHDTVYDLDDKPFYVPNGSIAIPVDISLNTGVKQGDTILFTTDTGYTYELEVCRIFKENIVNGLCRYIVSDEDYKVLTNDSVRKYISYNIRLNDASDIKKDEIENTIIKNDIPIFTFSYNHFASNDYIMLQIISTFIILVSIFLIIIIFMTIRFTLIADLKSEEKEIGMMKALGVDSLSFRWLFAAKYIVFSIVGGIIGIAAGLPLASMLVNMFGPNSILPERYIMVIIGLLSVVAMITVMILFSLFVMRRIKKISVIDAIHGENRGERFGKGFPMFLHKRRKMTVPLFLALTDILRRLKRYIFLIIAYSLGAAILLLVFNVRNSVINPRYSKYWLYHDYDFSIELSDEATNEIAKEKKKTGNNTYEIINRQLADADIPAHYDYMFSGGGFFIDDANNYTHFEVLWKEGEPEKYIYRKNGTVPKLANEAAMSAFTAKKLGIKPGDVIKMNISENNDEHTGIVHNDKEIVITALIDVMEESSPIIIMGDEYEGAFKYTNRLTGATIDTPENKKQDIRNQMEKLFKSNILDGRESICDVIGNLSNLFFLLEYGVGGAVMLVLMLITYLYMSIFVTEEVQETALLKSIGFRDSTVKTEYLLRITLLLIISLILGEVYIWTFGNLLFETFMLQYNVTGMRFIFEFPVNFIVIPLIMLTCLMLTSAFTLRGIKHIGIWKISEE